MADDEGRIEGDAISVRNFGFPIDATGLILKALEFLQEKKRIEIYRVEENEYIQVLKFSTHQYIQHPKTSKLPPSGNHDSSCLIMKDHDRDGLDQGSGIRDQGSGNIHTPTSTEQVQSVCVFLKNNSITRTYKFTSLQKKKIATRLKTYSVEEIQKALANFINDPWEERAKFNDAFEYVLGSDEKVDKWLQKLTTSESLEERIARA